MVLLEELFTAPASQGHGYGTRLVKFITDIVRGLGFRTDAIN